MRATSTPTTRRSAPPSSSVSAERSGSNVKEFVYEEALYEEVCKIVVAHEEAARVRREADEKQGSGSSSGGGGGRFEDSDSGTCIVLLDVANAIAASKTAATPI